MATDTSTYIKLPSRQPSSSTRLTLHRVPKLVLQLLSRSIYLLQFKFLTLSPKSIKVRPSSLHLVNQQRPNKIIHLIYMFLIIIQKFLLSLHLFIKIDIRNVHLLLIFFNFCVVDSMGIRRVWIGKIVVADIYWCVIITILYELLSRWYVRIIIEFYVGQWMLE